MGTEIITGKIEYRDSNNARNREERFIIPADSRQDTGVIQLGEQKPPKNPIIDLLKDPIVRDLGIAYVKKEMGLGKNTEGVAKKPFGRALYAMRDVWVSSWWTIPALAVSMSIIFLLFLWMRKVLGV